MFKDNKFITLQHHYQNIQKNKKPENIIEHIDHFKNKISQMINHPDLYSDYYNFSVLKQDVNYLGKLLCDQEQGIPYFPFNIDDEKDKMHC